MTAIRLLSNFNLFLTVSAALLLVLGLTLLSTLSADNLQTQVIAAVLAIIAFIFFSNTDYHIWSQLSRWLYLVAILLLVATLILGNYTRGASSWIMIGPVSLQPSEIARPLLVIFFAHSASLINQITLKNLLGFGITALIPLSLIMLQPDLGSGLLLIFGWLGVLIAMRISWKYWIVGILLVGITLPIGWQFLKDYQRARIEAFIDPSKDPRGSGYNVIQAQLAIGSGQLMGKGLGRGTQSHLRFLPENHTDFIFAALAEEFGFLGASGTIVLYGVLFAVMIKSLNQTQDQFAHYTAAGFFLTLYMQTMINIGMNQGIFPVTGVTLPLLSYGGSSLIGTGIILGVFNNILSHKELNTSLRIH